MQILAKADKKHLYKRGFCLYDISTNKYFSMPKVLTVLAPAKFINPVKNDIL